MKITSINAVFNCRVLGDGPDHIIAFHGFGQNGDAFLPIVARHPKYTIYAFDLPFHGDTKIPINSNCITNLQVVELIHELIKLTSIKNISILGFSIGARFVFPIIEKFSPIISNVWLLAPDGIYENNWFRLATGFSMSRHFFKSVLKFPHLLIKIGRGARQLNIVDKKTLLFVTKSIDTEKKRSRLFFTWTYLRNLNINAPFLSEKLKESNLEISVFLGRHDGMISKSRIDSNMKMIPNYKVIMLPCDHHDLINCFAQNFTH